MSFVVKYVCRPPALLFAEALPEIKAAIKSDYKLVPIWRDIWHCIIILYMTKIKSRTTQHFLSFDSKVAAQKMICLRILQKFSRLLYTSFFTCQCISDVVHICKNLVLRVVQYSSKTTSLSLMFSHSPVHILLFTSLK